MKVPRVTDFDPNAKEPTLKSSLERMPSIEKPKIQQGAQSSIVIEPSEVSFNKNNSLQNKPIQEVTERPNDRTVVRQNGKRIITRNSFEIYEDQMDSLRKIAFKEKMEGKIGSMSSMVREAIDTFLKKESSRE